MHRAARGRRGATGSGITAKLADHYPLPRVRRPASQAQSSPDRAVVRRRLGEHLARQDVDVVSHENVVDLAVRPVRRDTSAQHRASPAASEHRHDRRPPEIAVAGDDDLPVRATAAAAQRAQVATGASCQSLDDTCTATTSTSAALDLDRAHATPTRAPDGIARGCVPIGRLAARDDREPRADRDLPVTFTGISWRGRRLLIVRASQNRSVSIR